MTPSVEIAADFLAAPRPAVCTTVLPATQPIKAACHIRLTVEVMPTCVIFEIIRIRGDVGAAKTEGGRHVEAGYGV